MNSVTWEGDRYVCATTTYRHMPERDGEWYSAWELVGSGLAQYFTAKLE